MILVTEVSFTLRGVTMKVLFSGEPPIVDAVTGLSGHGVMKIVGYQREENYIAMLNALKDSILQDGEDEMTVAKNGEGYTFGGRVKAFCPTSMGEFSAQIVVTRRICKWRRGEETGGRVENGGQRDVSRLGSKEE